jgi:hypothetical protein
VSLIGKPDSMKASIALLLVLGSVPALSQVQDFDSVSPYRVQQIKVEQPKTAWPRIQEMKVEQPRTVLPTVQVLRVENPVVAWPKVEGTPPQDRPLASPGPIAVSDFKNGIYMLNGKTVAYEDLWQPTVGLGTVVPGIGWTYSKTGPGGDNYIPASQLLNDAVRPGSGFTAVMDCSIDTPDVEGSATVGVAIEAFSDPAGEHYSLAGAWFDPPSWGGSGGYPPFMGTTYAGAYQYITLRDIHRFAATLGPDENISVDGGPVQHAVSTHWAADVNAIYLDSAVEGSWTGPQRVVVERVAFYRTGDPKKLSILSRSSQPIPDTRVRQARRRPSGVPVKLLPGLAAK